MGYDPPVDSGRCLESHQMIDNFSVEIKIVKNCRRDLNFVQEQCFINISVGKDYDIILTLI